MRLARLHLLAGLLLLTECGSKQDLVLGYVALSEAGSSNTPGAGAGGDATAGTPAVSGAGGSVDPVGGTDPGVGGDAAGAAGAGDAGAPPEPPEDCLMGEEPPLGSLVHRYSFDAGGNVVDSIKGSNGTLEGGAMFGADGTLVLNPPDPNNPNAPDTKQFVNLPNGIVHDLTDVTVVAWTTWSGSGAAWQRIFDFGVSLGGEGQANGGRSYICVMPFTGFDNQNKPGLGAEMKVPGFPTVTLASTEDMDDRLAQVAFSFKGGVSAALYLDGTRLAMQATNIKPSDVDDSNNWLGKSQYGDNPYYKGTYEELRVYDVALNGCQLHTLLVRGPQNPD